jgi:type II secretory pathway pseudopilin PulG
MTSAVMRLRCIFDLRARGEHGFGMIELLAAMTVMLIGIFAVFAVFQAGMVQIRRASKVTTAAAVADSEIEKYRAIRFDSIGLTDTSVAAADATYKGNSAYKADTSPTTTLSGAMSASQLTLPVTSAAGFPAAAPFLVKIDSEVILVSGGAGTTTWTIRDSTGQPVRVGRGYLGTTPATHSAGVPVTQIQRASRCGTAGSETNSCTTSVPTKTVTGADGKAYRVDTYITWLQVANSTAPAATGRLLKYVTVIVRDSTSPYRVWARLSSSFDESTGV